MLGSVVRNPAAETRADRITVQSHQKTSHPATKACYLRLPSGLGDKAVLPISFPIVRLDTWRRATLLGPALPTMTQSRYACLGHPLQNPPSKGRRLSLRFACLGTVHPSLRLG